MASTLHPLHPHRHVQERHHHVHAEDVKLLRVDAATMFSKPGRTSSYTVYMFTIATPGTQTWWLVRKRYSQFLAVRNDVVRAHKRSHVLVQTLLEPVCDAPFPRKVFRGVHTPAVKDERNRALRTFTLALATLRMECMHLACVLQRMADEGTVDDAPLVLGQLADVYAIVAAFLHVPELQVQEEVRRLIAPHVLSHSTHAHLDDDDCAICLDDYVEDPAATALPCGHAFHDTCLAAWMAKQQTCPMCRDVALFGSTAVEYVARRVLQSADSLLVRLSQMPSRASAWLVDANHNQTTLSWPTTMRRRALLDFVCSVCFGHSYRGMRRLQCGHACHEPCLVDWMTRHDTCPSCRDESYHGYL
ncbi:Aste57867_13818 [Aphanomyces stellatus]|uniref:Aste57867_13818 protein n=1 Tax=Aphanomyces stellatus TaxID=120398 RepID=A0A485KZ23_9STRA|nr:hypothetical protein As57867_013768 [Aphanomyces stellatus]VFT90650.1 Aste57867_13818 [Aphanomyces stellatus]